MKKNILKLQLLIFLLGTTFAFAQSVNTLWYQEPANFFEESLVLGNGKMGASIFGGVNSDKIYLNDATLWSGEPVNANMNPDGYKNIPSIRKALKEENYKRADSINKFKLQGNFSEAYMPLGTLNIDFDHSNKPHKNYHRELDLTKAISKTSYEINGVQFTREYFISNPDQLMIIKLTSSKKEAINCSINFESLLKYTITETDKHYQVDGYAPYHVEPVYRKGFDNPVLFDKDRGTRFTTLIDIKNTDGKVLQKDNSLVLSDATEAVILVSIATSFNGFDKDPAKKGKDNNAIALNALQCGLKKSYKKLKKSHLKRLSIILR
jgi:alpha-L-fucosidase 2